MSAVSPLPVFRNTPDGVVKIDLDERAFLFPQTKALTQLLIYVHKPSLVRFEVAYTFNQARADPILFELSADDCTELSRRLVEAVYRAQSTQIVTKGLSLSVSVVANGYILQLNEHGTSTELFLGSGSIWRVCSGIARAVDLLAPIASN